MPAETLGYILKKHPRTIQRLAKRNNIPFTRVGRSHKKLYDPTYFYLEYLKNFNYDKDN